MSSCAPRGIYFRHTHDVWGAVRDVEVRHECSQYDSWEPVDALGCGVWEVQFPRPDGLSVDFILWCQVGWLHSVLSVCVSGLCCLLAETPSCLVALGSCQTSHSTLPHPEVIPRCSQTRGARPSPFIFFSQFSYSSQAYFLHICVSVPNTGQVSQLSKREGRKKKRKGGRERRRERVR